MEKGPLHSHNFVISTGAQRSGEICGFPPGSHARSLASLGLARQQIWVPHISPLGEMWEIERVFRAGLLL
jgi:hypothetical protein